MPTSTPEFSPTVLLTLIAIFLASLAVFYAQVYRWTTFSRRITLRDWAKRNEFRPVRSSFPPIVAPVIAISPLIDDQFTNGLMTILRLRTQQGAWNILVRRLETPWPTTGVRPAANTSSVLDLYSLASFPTLTTGERFVVYGTDSLAARSLASSSLRALLPHDIGLMFAGQEMMLDFTSRPFDDIAFNRMIALSDQLVAHLPAVKRK